MTSKTLWPRLEGLLFSWRAKPGYEYLGLFLITLLATGLRFYRLGEWSFWIDEYTTVVRSEFNIQNLGTILGQWRSWPPVSIVLTGAALDYFGTSEWSARLVPALLGIISVPVLYFPARRIFGPVVALFGVLLLAVAPWHLYWSQNARFYTALMLLYSLALLLVFLGFEHDRPWLIVLSLILWVMAFRERQLAFFLGPVIVIYLILLRPLRFGIPKGINLRNLLLYFLPVVIVASYFAVPFLTDPALWVSTFGRVNNNPVWIFSGVVYYLGIPTVGMAILGAVYLLRLRDRAALLLTLGGIVPLVSVMGLALVQYSANRYVFPSLMSWILVASFAAVELVRRSQGIARLLALGVLALLVFNSLGSDLLYYVFQNGNRDAWRAALNYVAQHKWPEDFVVAADHKLASYYLHETVGSIQEFDPSQAELSDARVWFVEDMNVEERWPSVHAWILKNAKLQANLDVYVLARNFKMRVYLYDPAAGTIGAHAWPD